MHIYLLMLGKKKYNNNNIINILDILNSNPKRTKRNLKIHFFILILIIFNT